MTQQITRRVFVRDLAVLVGSLGSLCLSVMAYAQQAASPRRIGVLLGIFSPESKEVQAFRQGLLDAGYVEGRDVVIEWRSAGGNYARVPEMVADLIQRKVEVIVVTTTIAAQAVKRATSTIPIVIVIVGDPVGSGLVNSLAHPGGNVTGLSNMSIDISAKRMQFLKEAIPRLARVAVLWNPDTPYHTSVIEELKAVAAPLSIDLSLVGVRTPEHMNRAFSTLGRPRADALYVVHDNLFANHRTALIELVAKARLPAIHPARQFVDAGGLMSYGANIDDQMRRSAGYVDRILKGAKPGDLPIEQPTKFELVVNLRTAKALGITIPDSVLLQADEVIR